MEESILGTIKSMLGVSDLDDAFDTDILVNINSAFSTLYQVGVGSDSHYFVLTGEETWQDVFLEEDLVDFIKLYTYMKVKLIFDPPTNASILQALTDQINEVEYRILLQADPAEYFNDDYISDGKHAVLSDDDIKEIWKEVMGNINAQVPGSALSDEELKEIWKEIMGNLNAQEPGIALSDEDLKEIWKEIMGTTGSLSPSDALSDEELEEIWSEIMGGRNPSDSNTVSEDELMNLWNEIMNQRGESL